LNFFKIYTTSKIGRPLTYSSLSSVAIGTIVSCRVQNRLEYGIVAGKISLEDIAELGFKIEKIKPIEELFEYQISQKDIDYIDQFWAYNMQNLGDIIDAFLSAHLAIIKSPKPKKEKLKPDFEFKNPLLDLSDRQYEISNDIYQKINQFRVHLIDGVTGSGKTMIYLDIVAKYLSENSGQTLVCLPEIALTPQTQEFFCSKLGFSPKIWHSGISKAKKRDTAIDIISGKERLIIGTRSAILLPFKDLKLVIIDEEHDGSYKQSDKMIYSGRDMAILRSKSLDIPIILLSATPSCETYFNAKHSKYNLYEINERYSKVQMPDVQIINMMDRSNKPRSGESISPTVLNIVKQVLDDGFQALFFLNRRGFASCIICGGCKNLIGCPNCSVNMAYHQSKNLLMCHYCGHSSQVPKQCDFCSEEDKWVKIGFGVERIADELAKFFPDQHVQIVSSDEVTKSNIDGVMGDIVSGKANIIIGTQMISKGYNFPKLKCVVIVDTDTGFLDGDFRIYEKTFQMITQVAGRAGRFDEKGLVLIQSYQEKNPALQAIQKYDKAGFYESEINRRTSKFNPLPPFYRQVAVIIAAEDFSDAKSISVALVKHFRLNVSPNIKIFGPAPSLVKRVNKQYRYRILLSCPKNTQHLNEIKSAIDSFCVKSNAMIKIDVDPLNFI
jgi:primosomal protein N' (replication factor Y) (superfamily II helicase)